MPVLSIVALYVTGASFGESMEHDVTYPVKYQYLSPLVLVENLHTADVPAISKSPSLSALTVESSATSQLTVIVAHFVPIRILRYKLESFDVMLMTVPLMLSEFDVV